MFWKKKERMPVYGVKFWLVFKNSPGKIEFYTRDNYASRSDAENQSRKIASTIYDIIGENKAIMVDGCFIIHGKDINIFESCSYMKFPSHF